MLLQILVILVVTAHLLTGQNLKSELPTREMDLSQYGQTIVPYSVSGNSDLALKLIKSLKFFLNLQNQVFREVQGKTHRKERDCWYVKTCLYHLQRKDLTMVFSYPFLPFPVNYQYLRGS